MKRKIIIGISAVIALAIGVWVLRQLSFGTISVTTNNQEGEVTLRQLGGSQEPKKIGKGDTSVRVTPGDYTVEISHNNKVTRGATTVIKGEESTLSLQTQDLKNQEKVTNYTALSIYATDASLSFLNVPQKLLYKYPLGSEKGDMLSETYPVVRVYHWYSSDDVFFQTNDGTYYVRSGGKDKPVQLTADPNTPEVDALDINTKGELVYVYNQKLYYRPTVMGATSEILSLKDTDGAPSVALNTNGTALVSFAPEGSGDNTDVSSQTSPALLVNISKKQKKQLASVIANGHWSPDNKRFVGTTERGLELFNSVGTSTTLISSLIDSSANTVTWVDNSRFIYADGNTVWLYNIIDGVSTKIAQIDGSLARNNPFAITSKTVYYETDPKPEAGAVGTIYRINL